jgi:hypothetical protein
MKTATQLSMEIQQENYKEQFLKCFRGCKKKNGCFRILELAAMNIFKDFNTDDLYKELDTIEELMKRYEK